MCEYVKAKPDHGVRTVKARLLREIRNDNLRNPDKGLQPLVDVNLNI